MTSQQVGINQLDFDIATMQYYEFTDCWRLIFPLWFTLKRTMGVWTISVSGLLAQTSSAALIQQELARSGILQSTSVSLISNTPSSTQDEAVLFSMTIPSWLDGMMDLWGATNHPRLTNFGNTSPDSWAMTPGDEDKVEARREADNQHVEWWVDLCLELQRLIVNINKRSGQV